MIADYPNEKWKEIVFDDNIAENEKFKISNYGRVINCKGKKEFLVKRSYTNGFQALHVRQKRNGKSTGRYVHRLVADHFLTHDDEKEFVIHLNYDNKDNRTQNLQWVSKKEKEAHQRANPVRQKEGVRRPYAKLTETKVKFLKRKLNDPNRKTRLKILAKRFGVSEMQLYRIKTGENWGDVTEY
jgi:hypothetical protein